MCAYVYIYMLVCVYLYTWKCMPVRLIQHPLRLCRKIKECRKWYFTKSEYIGVSHGRGALSTKITSPSEIWRTKHQHRAELLGPQSIIAQTDNSGFGISIAARAAVEENSMDIKATLIPSWRRQLCRAKNFERRKQYSEETQNLAQGHHETAVEYQWHVCGETFQN